MKIFCFATFPSISQFLSGVTTFHSGRKTLRTSFRCVPHRLLYAVEGYISRQLIGLSFFHRCRLAQRYESSPACCPGFQTCIPLPQLCCQRNRIAGFLSLDHNGAGCRRPIKHNRRLDSHCPGLNQSSALRIPTTRDFPYLTFIAHFL